MKPAFFPILAAACALAWPLHAESSSKSNPPVPPTAPLAEKKAHGSQKLLQPRAPVTGQAFDDREVELYIESEAKKLFTAERIKKLDFKRRTCALKLADPATEKLSWPMVAARAEAATLVLGEFAREGKSKDVSFSVAAGGFVVGESGACVTSLHVAKDKGSRGLCAMTRDGRVFPVREALATDPVNDLVILQIDLPAGVVLPTLALAAEPAPIGSTIVVMSHPDERFYMLTTGTVARHTIWRDPAGDEAFMAITADFAKGSSGCPVLDEHGAVVGIVNNTESIYYDDDGKKKQTDLQMVVKNTTPAALVRKMVEQP